MATYEGAWDCPACGRKRNRGPEKHCAGCGMPRGPEVAFYLPEDAPEVTDPAALDRAGSGPDWSCSYCGGDNRFDADHCTGCGAKKDAAVTRQVTDYRQAPREPPAPAKPPPPAPVYAGEPPKKRPKSRRRACLPGCLGALALAVVALFFTCPRNATVEVAGFAWERTVEIEARQTVRGEAWEDEVPAGARVVSSRRELHHEEKVETGSRRTTRTVTERVQTGTERVKVGVRDLGDGYFEDIYEERPVYETVERQETVDEPVYRTEPVYRDRVRYELTEWKPARKAQAQGRDRAAAWPRPALGGDEREGARAAVYTVFFTDADGEVLRYRAGGEEEWRRFELGRSYRARVGLGGRVKSVGGRAGD